MYFAGVVVYEGVAECPYPTPHAFVGLLMASLSWIVYGPSGFNIALHTGRLCGS
jgi:hypothetical protein